MVGSTLAHYRVEALIGEGGMGAVYRAFDTRLHRPVAIKILRADAEAPEAAARVIHEARAASALNHPHIVTIHSVEHASGVDFIVMEMVEGVPLSECVPKTGLPATEAVKYAAQIADAVAAAHEAGIVHRDLKPANISISRTGQVKVLDFGVARRTALPDDVTRQLTLDGTLAGPGVIVGTIGYLAPEQILGQPADARSDVFSIGAILYHMLTGRPPFQGDSPWAALDATIRNEPVAISQLRPDVEPALDAIVRRCLAKQPASRYASAGELAQRLHALEAPAGADGERRRWLVAAIVVAVAAAVLSGSGLLWMRMRDTRVERARAAIPEISRRMDLGDSIGAYRVARTALENAPNDPQVAAAFTAHTVLVHLDSEPSGADLQFRAYDGKDQDWIPLGRTPTTVRLPLGQVRWRVTKDGYEPLESSPNDPGFRFALAPKGTVPGGMVYVGHDEFNLESTGGRVALPDYYIDKFEVTNKQFKQFVDAGGYANRAYWTQPFVRNGRTLAWDEAMMEFRDATGRPGPSTWELGTYPDGQDDFPVSGVSWYEAAAYAAWAHKMLPTAYHWYNAAGAFGIFSDILRFSNFGGKATQAVGTSGGLGPYGTYDMAGNVKEWCWNETARGLRYILGGAFDEPSYQFRDEDAQPPFERRPGFGFRCMLQRTPVDPALLAPIQTMERDMGDAKPVTDEIFAVYKHLYDYDPTPIDGRVDELDDSNRYWKRERVSFSAAYGQTRVPAYLFLPRTAAPPYQTLVFFPASDALMMRTSREASLQWIEYLVRSGRAVMYPVYQDTYERFITPPAGSRLNFLRGINIQRAQDFRRAIDYLESRSDIDHDRIAFYGMSLGAQLSPIFLALEPERIKTAVLVSGGFETSKLPPETDPVNFAPRVRQPVLMVNGREDFDLPYQTSQVPFFNALGTPASDKRHVAFDGGHIPSHPLEVYRVVLDWLDKYLGPVKP